MSTIQVKLPESLYSRTIILARQDQISLDQFIATAVAEKIAALDTQDYLQQRAARGDRQKFEQAMAHVADVEPEEYDRL